jgi:hypothetical protein
MSRGSPGPPSSHLQANRIDLNNSVSISGLNTDPDTDQDTCFAIPHKNYFLHSILLCANFFISFLSYKDKSIA